MLHNLRLIPLLPFIGAAILILFGRSLRRPWVHLIATLAIGTSCLVSLDAFFTALPEAVEAGGLRDVVWTWIPSGDLNIDFAFRMDSLSGVLCLIITFIGTLIHIYSAGYMAHEPDHARFFGYLNLFCGAMLVLVLGDSLPVLFVGWEGVGLCSYLLIGFWYGETANANAGKKAFITNRVGDFGFLIGMFLLFNAAGTLDMQGIKEAAAGTAFTEPLWGSTVAFWAAVFLFIGAAGKSAQIPLYVWLPDAMAGPTPVSALIHAATMVTAGVYMVARLSAVYLLAPDAMAIVACVGAATALFAAIIGFAQNDFKKVLAYSTVSQLGFMFAGVGTGNFAGGVFHLGTHAFFKAGLFLCAGSVMHAMSGSGDITTMGGLRKKLPWTHGVFLACWLAIAGVPFFSGFFSKDAIVAGAFGSPVFTGSLAWVSPVVGSVLLAAALCTAFYMSRLYFLVFTGNNRADAHTQAHIHESPLEMVGPLVVLAIGAVLVGYVGLPPAIGELFHKPDINLLGHWLEPAVGKEPAIDHTLEWVVMGVSTLLAVGGIGLAWVFYGNGYRAPAHKFAQAVPGFVQLVRDKFRVDEAYNLVIIRPLRFFARILFWGVDRWLIDSGLVHGVSLVVDIFARLSRIFQTGDVQRYLAVFVIGVVALLWLAIRPPVAGDLTVERDPNSPTKVSAKLPMVASRPDLVYEFDFDGDGHAEGIPSTTPSSTFAYEGDGPYTVTVTVRDPRWGTSRTMEEKIYVKGGN